LARPPAQSVYWDGVANHGGVPSGHEFLRAYSDLAAVGLMNRWWQPDAVLTALKTDLYDENWSPAVFTRLASLNGIAAGVDVSPAVAARARRRVGTDMLSVADVRAMPFAPESIDRILSLSTIDHFEDAGDIGTALREFHRVMKPGGTIILTMDNPVNPVVWLRNALPFKFLHRLGLVPYFVGRTISPWALRRELERAGFEVRECTAAMHFPRVAVLAAHRLVNRAGERSRLLKLIGSFEWLGRLPSRYLTGYFTAVLASKPG
jgi:SAM-dependent methyltransferase